MRSQIIAENFNSRKTVEIIHLFLSYLRPYISYFFAAFHSLYIFNNSILLRGFRDYCRSFFLLLEFILMKGENRRAKGKLNKK